jgi:hypothetical protein
MTGVKVTKRGYGKFFYLDRCGIEVNDLEVTPLLVILTG